jgi:hypothetical protein
MVPGPGRTGQTPGRRRHGMLYDAYVWRVLILLKSGFSNNLDAVPSEPPVDFVEENSAAADGGRK